MSIDTEQIYKWIIDQTVTNLKNEFQNEGYEDSVLQDIREKWIEKMSEQNICGKLEERQLIQPGYGRTDVRLSQVETQQQQQQNKTKQKEIANLSAFKMLPVFNNVNLSTNQAVVVGPNVYQLYYYKSIKRDMNKRSKQSLQAQKSAQQQEQAVQLQKQSVPVLKQEQVQQPPAQTPPKPKFITITKKQPTSEQQQNSIAVASKQPPSKVEQKVAPQSNAFFSIQKKPQQSQQAKVQTIVQNGKVYTVRASTGSQQNKPRPSFTSQFFKTSNTPQPQQQQIAQMDGTSYVPEIDDQDDQPKHLFSSTQNAQLQQPTEKDDQVQKNLKLFQIPQYDGAGSDQEEVEWEEQEDEDDNDEWKKAKSNFFDQSQDVVDPQSTQVVTQDDQFATQQVNTDDQNVTANTYTNGVHPTGGIEEEEEEDDDDSQQDEVENVDDQDENIENVIVALYEKVSKRKDRWRVQMKAGFIIANGQDYIFNKGLGEFDFVNREQ